MNAHDAIVDGFLQALRYPAPVTDGRIEEELDLDTIGEAEAEAVSVALERSAPVGEQINGQPVDWRSTVTVECFARADSRNDVPTGGRASRRLHARVYERLSADRTLGGRAWLLSEPELAIESRPFASRAGVCTALYEVGHRTESATLEVA